MGESDHKAISERQIELLILGISRIKLKELGYIFARNVFLLTNGIIFAVVIMLVLLGDRQAGLFLGIVLFLMMALGLAQDINAWMALDKLQLLTAPHVVRLGKDGSQQSILVDEIKKGERIALKMGDQVPCDSSIIASQSLEINEGLITGESTSIPRSEGEHLLAGSVVTSGTGIILVETVFHESRIARMTEGIKRYSVNLSPIQSSVNLVIKYSGYVLVATLLFTAFRGYFLHEPLVRIVKSIGALTSMIVPAGLIFAVTLLFAYGAAHFFRRKVLLQEVNATEKMGRIKNLCMDKTGTLTENTLVVEKMHLPSGIDENLAKELTSAYIRGTEDSSQTIGAVKKFIQHEYAGEIAGALPFSSWRQYGASMAEVKDEKIGVLAGSPDIFLPHIKDQAEKKWLEALIAEHAHEGKRILAVVKSEGADLPHKLENAGLSVVAAFSFFNNLREGIRDTIDFFQNRGVRIRIISGDNPETVRTVSALAGIKDTEKVIVGREMEKWNETDFQEKAKQYTIFARIIPEQKEKIIEALKSDGFTAMVGDGANDALAIKKADLGIAMFEGAPATRQLAAVVLMNNSFTALPGGVELADSIIRNIEILASIFFNLSLVGLWLFGTVSLLGYLYPLTPLNITLINYFTIGIPSILVSYWAIRPSGKVQKASNQSFLQRVLPFAAWSSIIQGLAASAMFILSPDYLKTASSDTFVVVTLIVLGFIFFALASEIYRSGAKRYQRMQLIFLGAGEFLLLLLAFKIPLAVSFFEIMKSNVSSDDIIKGMIVLCVAGIAQLALGWRYMVADNNA